MSPSNSRQAARLAALIFSLNLCLVSCVWHIHADTPGPELRVPHLGGSCSLHAFSRGAQLGPVLHMISEWPQDPQTTNKHLQVFCLTGSRTQALQYRRPSQPLRSVNQPFLVASQGPGPAIALRKAIGSFCLVFQALKAPTGRTIYVREAHTVLLYAMVT